MDRHRRLHSASANLPVQLFTQLQPAALADLSTTSLSGAVLCGDICTVYLNARSISYFNDGVDSDITFVFFTAPADAFVIGNNT